LDTVVFAFVSGLFAAKWKRGSDDVNPVIGLNIVAEFERTAIADQELVVEYLRDAVCAAGLQRELYVVPDDVERTDLPVTFVESRSPFRGFRDYEQRAFEADVAWCHDAIELVQRGARMEHRVTEGYGRTNRAHEQRCGEHPQIRSRHDRVFGHGDVQIASA